MNSSEIIFMFKNVERGNEQDNLILFTPNSGTVYKIDGVEPEFLGFINGIFEPNEILSQDISTLEGEFLDIKIGEEIFQIIK